MHFHLMLYPCTACNESTYTKSCYLRYVFVFGVSFACKNAFYLTSIVHKTTIRAVLTEVYETDLQPNTTRVFDRCKGTEDGDNKVLQICNSKYLGSICSFVLGCPRSKIEMEIPN